MDGIKILYLHTTDNLSNCRIAWTFQKFGFLCTFENLARSDEISLKQVINAAFCVNTDKLIYLGVN